MTRFPILMTSAERKRFPSCPTSVPWELVAPHEEQAKRNHGQQTLVQLAERGGLSPCELRAAVNGVGLKEILRAVDGHRYDELLEQDVAWLMEWAKD